MPFLRLEEIWKVVDRGDNNVRRGQRVCSSKVFPLGLCAYHETAGELPVLLHFFEQWLFLATRFSLTLLFENVANETVALAFATFSRLESFGATGMLRSPSASLR